MQLISRQLKPIRNRINLNPILKLQLTINHIVIPENTLV